MVTSAIVFSLLPFYYSWWRRCWQVDAMWAHWFLRHDTWWWLEPCLTKHDISPPSICMVIYITHGICLSELNCFCCGDHFLVKFLATLQSPESKYNYLCHIWSSKEVRWAVAHICFASVENWVLRSLHCLRH